MYRTTSPAMGTPTRSEPDRLEFERRLRQQGLQRIAGVDEAGRGPLAGPVVAAAVVLPTAWLDHGLPSSLSGLNDSKQLNERTRDSFFELLTTLPGVGRGVTLVHAPEIDALNILRATHRAMSHALAQLFPPPEHVLVDGLRVHSLSLPQTPIVHGDARSFTIAAASVIAKVTRDRLMRHLDTQYPGYGFATHKGYGTPEHLDAIRRLGPCPIHRRTFAPLKATQTELFPQT